MSKYPVVVGLGFGDEGKGTIVDFLSSELHGGEYYHSYVVRFSGGPQAAHNVIGSDGTHHTFAQFGSGTLNGCGTILSRFMSVNPLNLIKEAEVLEKKIGRNPLDVLQISENSLLITPWHQGFNRLQELRRGDAAHGSCGQGVGVAQKFAVDYPELALRMGDLLMDRDSFVAKLMIVWELLKAEYGRPTSEEMKAIRKTPDEILFRTPGNLESMYRLLMNDHKLFITTDQSIANLIGKYPCIFEGSQGALLDEWKGFHPYTTWSTTTSQNALQLLSEAGVDDSDIEVIGVTRSYHTRHGYGPFPTENHEWLEEFPEPHNAFGKYQGAWRVGALDLGLLNYGVKVNPRIDTIALTFLDRDFTYISQELDLDLPNRTGDLAQQEDLTNDLFERTDGYPIRYPMEQVKLPSGSWNSLAMIIAGVTGKFVSIESYGPRTDQKVRVDRPWDR